eukprot:gene2481-16595_t
MAIAIIAEHHAAMSSVMWAAGDVVAQGVFDPSRTFRRNVALVGIPAGMWMHAWFKCLDAWFPGKRTFGTLCAMAIVDWLLFVRMCDLFYLPPLVGELDAPPEDEEEEDAEEGGCLRCCGEQTRECGRRCVPPDGEEGDDMWRRWG